ncbi:hypothetical protein G4G27_14790 [Sphingomonas sp. So64.6b]|uniref:hypothetical protein n=1 Tax=Sphingomonas sp. So64.6b TaxID=2997354 RepID=UPI0016018E7F|nr:hypothetical protein [Sphingomonas sp. So64.6b]QNA85119.1 hypothetical protein G4G27_14790 [Sphingomonas sp. So64.6b]
MASSAFFGERPGARWRPVIDCRTAIARRGALTLMDDPIEILRHGVPMGLSPTETALIALLVRRGRATQGEIAALFADVGSSAAHLSVNIFRIRRKFAAAGAPDPVEVLRGWGLRLRVEPDARGSTSLWIGGSGDIAAGMTR